MKPGHTGVRRLYHAAHYSLAGLRFAYRSESAFRQECWIVLLLFPLGAFLGGNAVERTLLLGSLLLVLVVELLNTAIEAAVDRTGEHYHALAGGAKDAASAAVLLSLGIAAVTWGLILWERLI